MVSDRSSKWATGLSKLTGHLAASFLAAPRTLRGWTLFPTFAKRTPFGGLPADGNTGA